MDTRTNTATTEASIFEGIVKALSKPLPVASYSAYIAHVTHQALKAALKDSVDIVRDVTTPIQRDGTYAFNTTKTMEVTDFNGTRYRITIEDLRDVESEARRQRAATEKTEAV